MQASDLENVFNVMNTSAMAGYQGFMIGSGIGGGFGGGSSIMGSAGQSTVNVGGLGSSGALSTGASGASSAGSFSLSAGGGSGMFSGFSWNRAMQSFNEIYSKQSSMQNMFSQFGALGQSLGALFGNARNNRYNFIY